MASTRRWYGLGFTAAMIAALLVPVLAGVAPAATVDGDRVGAYDPATSYWSLDGGGTFLYGNPGDAPFMGDWNCDGIDTPGLHRPVDTAQGPAGKVYLRNSNSTGIADVEYFFGDPGDVAFAGDFNGNGCDSVGLYRPSTGQVFLTNLLGSRNRGIGAAQVTYTFPAQGRDLSGARAIAADFDGDGIDTVALHLPATGTVLGVKAAPMTFGDPGDQVVAGAFGGSVDSLGAYRNGSFLLGRPGELTASTTRSLRAGAGSVALSWSATSGPAPRSGHGGGPCDIPHPSPIVGTPQADVINGTSGDDVIAGLGGNDVIGGKDGNDIICGGDGDDILNGDRGNDVVYGDAGVDNVNGNDGNDTLHGGPGADIITGDKDDDTLFGDGGADNMNGGSGNDFLDGGDGDDLMSGSGGDDTLLGRAGADVINGGPQFDTCDVGPGGASATKCENQRPQALDQDVTVQEDDGNRTFAFATVDPDGDPTTYAVLSGPTPSKGVLTNNGNGTFTYNPNGDFESLAVGESAFVTFTYDATDVHGAVSDVATVTIEIEGNNDAPTAGDDAASTDEDTAVLTGNVLLNDTDPDTTDVLSVAAVDAASANGVPITNNGNGTFTYDPAGVLDALDAGDTFLDTFDYTVSDGNGGTDTGTVTVTVAGLDDPPFAGDDTASTNEDTPITITVLGNDGDPDADDGVTVIAPVNNPTGFSSGAGAAMVNNGDGTFDYDPTSAFNYLAVGESATDSFTYQVASTNVGTAEAAVTITVDGRNDAPSADDQTVDGTGTFVITLTGSDPDTSDDLDFAVPAATTAGGTLVNLGNTNGTCAPAPCTAPDKNSATVEYTVPTGGAVPDSFDFTVDDGTTTATGTVTINPDPAGDPTDPPTEITGIVAEDDDAEVVAGTTKEIVIRAAAPSTIGDLTFSIVSGPPVGEGAITSGPTGIPPQDPGDPVRSAKVTYDPEAFVGSDLTSPDTSFTFKACEAAVPTNCDQGVISIDVAAATPAAPPKAGPLSGTVNTNSTATINLALGLTSSEGEDDELPKGRSHTGSDPDIYFLVDVTGSMSGKLSSVEDTIVGIMASVKTVHPNAHFGLGTYDDIGTSLNPENMGPPYATLFDNLVVLGPDDGSVSTPGDVSAKIGAAGKQLVNSTGGDLPEAQFYALDRLAKTAVAGFNPNTRSVIVIFGDAPAHDPVCNAISQVGDITEQSVIAALAEEGGAGISLVAASLVDFFSTGLDAAPGPGGEYQNGQAPDCATVGGDAGQATRISAATGGSFHVNANAATLASAVLAAVDGRPAEFTYEVLLPLDFAGTLTTSTGATVPLNTLTALPDAKVVYNSTGITLGTQTQFQYKVTSALTGLSVTQDVFIDVTQVGSCEVSADFCDNGRP